MAKGLGTWVSEKKRVGFITQDGAGDIAERSGGRIESHYFF